MTHTTKATGLERYSLMNEKEAAAVLKISTSKLQKDRVKGTGLPFVKLGGCIRYKAQDIIDYIERSTR